MQNKKYTLANSTLTFNASRSDNGDFVCTVSNSEGSTEAAFKMNVKCKRFKSYFRIKLRS